MFNPAAISLALQVAHRLGTDQPARYSIGKLNSRMECSIKFLEILFWGIYLIAPVLALFGFIIMLGWVLAFWSIFEWSIFRCDELGLNYCYFEVS
tara:strand:- start:688 stop:972 length:285 start_codon:yes stop_codon:yes gene_type:complete